MALSGEGAEEEEEDEDDPEDGSRLTWCKIAQVHLDRASRALEHIKNIDAKRKRELASVLDWSAAMTASHKRMKEMEAAMKVVGINFTAPPTPPPLPKSLLLDDDSASEETSDK